jgi:hypothetical protein
MTEFQRKIKKAVEGEAKFLADKIVCHKNGTVSIMYGYYYRRGNTATKWADEVVGGLEKMGFNVRLVEARDDFRRWPADSYFVTVIEEIQ